MEITRNQAIHYILNLWSIGFYVPMRSIGNGGAGFDWFSPYTIGNGGVEYIANFRKRCYDTDKYDFKVIPMDEVAPYFEYDVIGLHLEGFDACVEFKEKNVINPYREQYLLWNFYNCQK